MKSEIYNAFAAFNRGIDTALESLTILHQEGVWSEDYAQQQREIFEQHRASVNRFAHNKLQFRETEDEDHYSKMREATEKRLRGETSSNS